MTTEAVFIILTVPLTFLALAAERIPNRWPYSRWYLLAVAGVLADILTTVAGVRYTGVPLEYIEANKIAAENGLIFVFMLGMSAYSLAAFWGRYKPALVRVFFTTVAYRSAIVCLSNIVAAHEIRQFIAAFQRGG